MPLLKLETTVTVPDGQGKALMAQLSQIMAQTIGKPEQYVMVSISSAAMLMSGQDGPAAFADIRSIGGLGGAVNRALAEKISKALNDALGIPAGRIFLCFTNVEGSHWGWNGSTLG